MTAIDRMNVDHGTVSSVPELKLSPVSRLAGVLPTLVLMLSLIMTLFLWRMFEGSQHLRAQALFTGILFSLLISYLTLVMQRTHNYAVQLARKMTRKLRESEDLFKNMLGPGISRRSPWSAMVGRRSPP